MRAAALLLLRLSLGLLMVFWGLDKIVNVAHGVAVAETFYLGLVTAPGALRIFGGFQVVIGLLIVLGWMSRITYPVLLAITGVTLLGVWRSVVDPWGWALEGSNVLFYPSLIIFAGSLVLWAFRAEDRWAIDSKRGN